MSQTVSTVSDPKPSVRRVYNFSAGPAMRDHIERSGAGSYYGSADEMVAEMQRLCDMIVYWPGGIAV